MRSKSRSSRGAAESARSRRPRARSQRTGTWSSDSRLPWRASRSSPRQVAGAVLKVTPPEDDEADEEPDALDFWGGHGAVRLLRRDDRRRVMLIERAAPGADLCGLEGGRGDVDRGHRRHAPLASRLDAIPVDRRPRAALARQRPARGPAARAARPRALRALDVTRDARPRRLPSPQPARPRR